MSIDKEHLKELIVEVLNKAGIYSDPMLLLLLGTAAHESHLGTYLRQLKGPALGIFQMEPNTAGDIWDNYLKYKPHFVEKIISLTNIPGLDLLALKGNLIYQILMTAFHYIRRIKQIPYTQDINEIANLWKTHYNTNLGKGTVEEFISDYEKFILN